MKPSTRQRFVSLEFGYPAEHVEATIVAHESGVALDLAQRLATIAARVRALREHGLVDGVSTRLLVYTGQLVVGGIAPRRACDIAITRAIGDDPDVQQAVADIVDIVLP